jgi:hypothetical protein
MADTQANVANDNPFGAVLDCLYGEALSFALFDVQLCRHIDLPWLLGQAQQCGASEAEIERLVATGIIRAWTDRDGNDGFLLYTPRPIKTFKELQAFGRYEEEEIRHIMACWNSDIECTLEILPYDELDTSDFESFRRRIYEHIDETKQQMQWRQESPSSADASSDDFGHLAGELEKYEKVARKLDLWSSVSLTKGMRDWIGRNLFRLRWVDEWVRFSNAEKYRASIVQGFGPEVFFSGYSQSGSEFTFSKIDWKITLSQLQYRASRGKRFPLRTPDFDFTQNGLTFPHYPSPEPYSKIFERYGLADLQKAIEGVGPGLWTATTQPVNSAVCAGCGCFFQRTLPAKQYCSEKCRSRAKQRRYRERDPERARLAQARYWKNYDEDYGTEL